jgi:hypothetical protein
MNKGKLSMMVMGASLLATVISGYVFVSGQNILNIAGTQWILVGIALGIYGSYLLHCPCGEESNCCKSKNPAE